MIKWDAHEFDSRCMSSILLIIGHHNLFTLSQIFVWPFHWKPESLFDNDWSSDRHMSSHLSFVFDFVVLLSAINEFIQVYIDYYYKVMYQVFSLSYNLLIIINILFRSNKYRWMVRYIFRMSEGERGKVHECTIRPKYNTDFGFIVSNVIHKNGSNWSISNKKSNRINAIKNGNQWNSMRKNEWE